MCLEKTRETNRMDVKVMLEKMGTEFEHISLNTFSSERIMAADQNKAEDSKMASQIGSLDPGEVNSSSEQTKEDCLLSGCQTPTGSIFDPFAPGPEELIFAPKKKSMKENHVPLRRQLNFDCCVDMDDAADEEQLLESLYRSLLELVLSNQVKEFSGEELELNSFFDGIKTPTSMPFLTGVADTCPPAPPRPVQKMRNISLEICRKLEF